MGVLCEERRMARSRTVRVLREKEQTDSAARARRSPICVCGCRAISGSSSGGDGRYLVGESNVCETQGEGEDRIRSREITAVRAAGLDAWLCSALHEHPASSRAHLGNFHRFRI